jgi:TolA-binding protein
VDREKAIAAYREVVRLYPNTDASSEATRNIQTLMRFR